MKTIVVADVMKTKVNFVDRMATVSEALSSMENIETKCLIVNKRNDNDELGIVIISDIARKVLALDRSPDRVNVYEVMTKPIISVRKDMDIRYCARLFSNFHISRSAVVDEGKVIGIVSYTDMVIKGLCKISGHCLI